MAALSISSAKRKKSDSGKRLLQAGHDGLSGFTSVAFKMHEGIR